MIFQLCSTFRGFDSNIVVYIAIVLPSLLVNITCGNKLKYARTSHDTHAITCPTINKAKICFLFWHVP